MSFSFKDLKQSCIGAFMGVVLLYAIRAGQPFYFDPTKGLIITGILLWIYYNGYRMKDKFEHYIINIAIAFVISALLANTFGLADWDKVLSYDVFGSLVIIGFWVALISAMLYDRYDFVSPMKRYYVRK